MTYDWLMRLAIQQPGPVATNLAAIFIDDDSLATINKDYGFYWPWPRQLYGKIVRELAAERAKVVAFDVFFIERHPDFAETRVKLANGVSLSSDAFLARELRRAGNVALGTPVENAGGRWHALALSDQFRTNAWAVGDAASDKDADAVLRRARPFKDDPVYGRLWHLGILLAAAELNLDLAHAVVEPGRVILHGASGITRTIPLDEDGFFFIDWTLAWNDKRILKASFEDLLGLDAARRAGDQVQPDMRDKLVVIGSIGSGNNISDMGGTPVANNTYLMSAHWNVANSVLTGRFIRAASLGEELGLIVLLGVISALLTWRLRALVGSAMVLVLISAYTLVAVWAFTRFRFWLPIVLPLGGALLMTHVCLVTYRVIVEQNERRRVKSIFQKIVSPDVVNELLGKETLSLGGARRNITVFFADVRGFTQMTDDNQKKAEEYVRQNQLTGGAAEAHYEESARETLATVNLYLATIADNIKKHNGTLDKYIGDCVMAFWGAPMNNERHALTCVRAAIDSQRAMYELNQQRFAENKRREQENATRAAAGQPPRPPLALLSLGTGINTGTVTVGLMGSDAHILNYTVFGREVNLASRLEGVSGRGRIIISETTYAALARDDAALAAQCVGLAPVTVKGISQPVKIYEVPWKTVEPQDPSVPTAAPGAAPAAPSPPAPGATAAPRVH